jgi:hypothetical protein
MKITICIRWAIVQYKQGALVIFPLLHVLKVSWTWDGPEVPH